MSWPFQPNQTYSRREDIHQVYGGQRQSGIVTPRDFPAIFLFTGRGDTVGYQDRWEADGSLRYTGEGQIGDMRMASGNRAVRDHAADGRDLLLFEKSGSGKPVRFLGFFYCAGWEIERQPDRNGVERDAIVFSLVPADRVLDTGAEGPAEGTVASFDLTRLRERAIAAAQSQKAPGQATRSVYERSRDVRNYVLARANGHCEACAAAAPFMTKAGTPYLEPHHIRRLSDGGPDHPKHVAAICPNCHRRAHYGSDAIPFNQALAASVAKFEDSMGLMPMAALMKR